MNSIDPALLRFGFGQPVRRREDARFLTGHGRYVADLQPAGCLHAVFLRSPYAHARLGAIDVGSANSMPGVVAVFTGADLQAAGIGPVPARSVITNSDGSPVWLPQRPALAVDRVRHVGECVALVVAQTLDQARDAAEAIAVDYDMLPAVANARDALAADAPKLFDRRQGNLAFDWTIGDAAAVAAAKQKAAHIVELDLVNNRLAPNPMEMRGVVVEYDATSDRFTYSGSLQNAPNFKALLCEATKLAPQKLRVVAPDVGGGFGGKNQVQPDQVALLFAAMQLKRPIKWIAERNEGFLSDAHARDLITTVRLALDGDAKFLALEVETIANLGGYLSMNGVLIPTVPTAAVLGGAYAFPAMHMHVRAAYTNTVPTDAYRGAGRPEAIYLTERVIDKAAAQLGLDPAELRRRNLIAPSQMPFKTALGRDIDCGDFPAVLDRALKLADREGFAARRAESEARGKRRGLGIGYYLEATLGPPQEHARLAFGADGKAVLTVGTQSNGQGHETTFPQLAAAKLGLDAGRIGFMQSDTDAAPQGGGHGGSRSLHIGGAAVLKASERILEKARAIAGHLLEASPVDLEQVEGGFAIVGTDRRVSWDRVIEAAFDRGKLPAGIEPGLEAKETHERQAINFPNGCHIAEVEIDPDTGAIELLRYSAVDDFGRVLNPPIVRGQVLGGIAQGIGQAMLEEARYDADGQLIAATFMDYAMPRADHFGRIDIELFEDAPTASNAIGAKGCGEAGATGAPPALVLAALDALRPLGVETLDMPLTQQLLWQAIQATRR